MKRKLILLYAGLLAVLLLCACGTGNAKKAPDPTPDPTPEPTPPPTSWTVTTESDADILDLANIPSLQTVDATQSREYDAILQLRELRPDIDLTWNYEFQGTLYPCDTTELTVTDLTGLEDAIRYLPEVNYIDLIESNATVEDLDRFDAIRPGIFYYWSFVLKDIHWESVIRTDIQIYSTLHITAASEGFGLSDEEMYPMLKYCKRLKALDLGHNDLTDASIRLIGELTDLEVLILGDNPNLTDLSPLGNLTKLTFLEVFLNHDVKDFSFLNQLTNLDMLEACYCDHLTSLDFLANMPNFKVGMFKYSGVSREEFLKWEAKLPEGAWMVFYDGDPWSCSSGWRDLLKTNQIQVAFSSWRNITDYRSYDDYDVDYTKANYMTVWELEYEKSLQP
ncbi:MAG: hypothetical protein II845_04045 [Oscillospiraceae bacterium]|nr:hypothetical protein [Oscillospiraceae bacterium]